MSTVLTPSKPKPEMLSEAAHLQFDCQGFFVLRSVLSMDEVSMLKEELARLERRTYDDQSWIEPRSMPSKCDFAEALRLNGLLRLSTVFDFIIGHEAVMPYLDAFVDRAMLVNTWSINKYQGRGSVSWHSGVESFKHYSYAGQVKTSMLNMIWALDENNEETGCPIVLPGSHKRSFDYPMDYELLAMPGSIPVLLDPGDVLLFSEATLHGGLPRKVPGSRRNLYINYIDAYTAIPDDGNLHHYYVPAEIRQRFPEEKQHLFSWMCNDIYNNV